MEPVTINHQPAKETRTERSICLCPSEPPGLRESQKPQGRCHLTTIQEIAKVHSLQPGHPPAGKGGLPPFTGDNSDVCMRPTSAFYLAFENKVYSRFTGLEVSSRDPASVSPTVALQMCQLLVWVKLKFPGLYSESSPISKLILFL